MDSSSHDRSTVTKSNSLATSSDDESVRGTQLGAGDTIVMQAGRDLTLASTAVASQSGGIALAAGNDIKLLATQQQHDAVVDKETRKKTALSSKTVTTHDETHDSLAMTSSLSGEQISIAAGNDLLSQGTQIVGTGDVVLAAGNNLTLETAQSTHSEAHDKKTVKTGLFGSGGIGFTIGKQTVKTEADIADVSHTGTTVGSLEGNVTLVAGNTLAITGSDVMALQGDITAKAKDIAVTEVHDTSSSEQRTAFKQGGLSVTLSAAALNLAQAAMSSADAGKKAEGDSRMQALAGASAAYSAYGAGQAASNVMNADTAKGAAQAANVSISVTVGGSQSESETKQRSSTSKGSTLQAGGNVNLIATGGGEDSNILVRGSDIKAGNNLLLAADNNITLEAAQDSFEQHSTSKSKSAAIGVAVTYGADGFAAGITASASSSRGKADGEDVTQRNSHLSAGKTATIISGNDTTLKGAVLSADTVLADIGGDLNIESLQDTSTYASKDKAVGGSVTFGVGFSASASYSSNKVNGDFASVTEQSGIQAGNGGFDIRVGGNTDLKGGVIASTQAAVDAGTNRLQTGTLTVSDITNTSSYEAKGISLSGGYAAGGSDGKEGGAKAETQTPPTTNNGSSWSWQNQGSGAQGAAAGYSSKSGSDTSLTTSGISGGTLVITDQAGQQAKTGQSVSDVLAALNRDVLTGDSANGLVKAWDGQKLQQQVSAGAEITATFGQQASKVVGDYATTKANQLRLQGNEEEAAKWDEGGEYRVAAHTAMGLLGGGAQGALGSATAATAAPILNELTKNLPDGVREAVGAGIAAGLGAAVGGSAGAATAFNEDANNRLLHPKEAESLNKFSEAFARYLNDGEEPTPDQIEEAKRRLTERALYQIDSSFSKNESAKNDNQAAGFLSGLSNRFGPTAGDVGGGTLFDARGTAAYHNHIINSQYILDNFSAYNNIDTRNINRTPAGYSGAYLAYAAATNDPGWATAGTTLEQAKNLADIGNVLKGWANSGLEIQSVASSKYGLMLGLNSGNKLSDPSIKDWFVFELLKDTVEGPVGLGDSGTASNGHKDLPVESRNETGRSVNRTSGNSNESANPPPTDAGVVEFPSNDAQVKHIFRSKPGHLADSPESRELLIGVAQDSNNKLGVDAFGAQWFAKNQVDGTQVWVTVRNGIIQNAGVNKVPRTFDARTGLSKPTK
ncbi:hemagglutinin repeat-containing protein [Xanthomonas prunicola]|uniref:Hemagglutinin repeat-containing protein n=1 Tax=Xanthomonas prunicola TaxID=2053930 RepID=A0A9Q9J1F8_9XANT|nr:hemagglutinin repeat-containing protein [Xanthomonas prunicola]UXA50836.1 hemagglutinin repeat-containing protein [Xanthomonas prunicola]UXA61284.1 hemagglutinin repeat-containing protein [Xanthomonas prunicola]UXA67352.1 hemagglutinin repeat-containing protein [Xanthomonas prunicola]